MVLANLLVNTWARQQPTCLGCLMQQPCASTLLTYFHSASTSANASNSITSTSSHHHNSTWQSSRQLGVANTSSSSSSCYSNHISPSTIANCSRWLHTAKAIPEAETGVAIKDTATSLAQQPASEDDDRRQQVGLYAFPTWCHYMSI